jgi:hypothetical protein
VRLYEQICSVTVDLSPPIRVPTTCTSSIHSRYTRYKTDICFLGHTTCDFLYGYYAGSTSNSMSLLSKSTIILVRRRLDVTIFPSSLSLSSDSVGQSSPVDPELSLCSTGAETFSGARTVVFNFPGRGPKYMLLRADCSEARASSYSNFIRMRQCKFVGETNLLLNI